MIFMPNKLNNGTSVVFLGILCLFMLPTTINLQKMQIPEVGTQGLLPRSISTCLATIGVCVFSVLASVGTLFYFPKCVPQFLTRGVVSKTGKSFSKSDSGTHATLNYEKFVAKSNALRRIKMSEKTRKITKLSLYSTSFLCCVISLIILLIPFSLKIWIHETGTPSGGTAIEISSERYEHSRNFYDFLEWENSNNYQFFDEGDNFITYLEISLVVSVALAVVEIFLRKRMQSMPNKKIRLIINASTLIFAIFALMAFKLAIDFQADGSGSSWKGYDWEHNYLAAYGISYDKNYYYNVTFKLIPVIICSFIAFLAQLGAGILNFLPKSNGNAQKSALDELGEDGAEFSADNIEANVIVECKHAEVESKHPTV